MKYKNAIPLIFNTFKEEVLSQNGLSFQQIKALHLIANCKSEKLGFHVERCTKCAYRRVHYNSCGNRNCPNCQGVNKTKWIYEREQDLLPVKYFHAVFTVPKELRGLFRFNKKVLYDLLFRTVKETLFEFGLDKRQHLQAKLGFISILHTWNQKLQYHPHIHCIIPGGGIDKHGRWKTSKGQGNFLFHVKALSDKFKKKFIINLVQLYKEGSIKLPPNDPFWSSKNLFYQTKSKLYLKKWVVYNKEAFGGPQQVLEYLARYTHRIAISNHRIVKITKKEVTFSYLDRKNKVSKTKTVTGIQFILMFLQHVLPHGFTKIRHYGFLSSRSKTTDLVRIRLALKIPDPPPKIKLSTRQILTEMNGIDPFFCPICKTDSMQVIEVKPSIRGSPARKYTRMKTNNNPVNLVL